jgi:hypothetical protein
VFLKNKGYEVFQSQAKSSFTQFIEKFIIDYNIINNLRPLHVILVLHDSTLIANWPTIHDEVNIKNYNNPSIIRIRFKGIIFTEHNPNFVGHSDG